MEKDQQWKECAEIFLQIRVTGHSTHGGWFVVGNHALLPGYHAEQGKTILVLWCVLAHLFWKSGGSAFF